MYFDKFKTVVLALVYPKGTKDDLTAAEKKRIKRAIEDIEHELEG